MVKFNVISAGLRATAIALGFASGLAVSMPVAQAQQSKPTATKAAPKAADTGIQWLKICEFAVTKKSDQSKSKVCLVHYEQRTAPSGAVVVSVAIRQIEGTEKERFIVMVPLGVAIPHGLKVRVDNGEPIDLRYSLCHPQGCTAEGDASKEFVAKLKKGNKLLIAAVNAFGRVFQLPVHLKGFTATYGGEAVDASKVEEIRKNEWEKLKLAYETQKAKDGSAAPKKAQ